MKISFNWILFASFLTIFIGIGAIGLIAYQNNKTFISTTQEIDSSNKILAQSEIILDLDNGKEAAIRDYILTGDSSLLHLFEKPGNSIFDHISQLRVLLRGNPEQIQKADSLVYYTHMESLIFDSAIALRHIRDTQAAIALVSNRDWKTKMEGVDKLISNIELTEADILEQHEKANRAIMHGLNHTLLFLIFIPLALLIVSFFAVRNTLSVRKMSEQKVIVLNRSLEQKVRERTFQLEESNKDLESFGYSVSHDLRAPLRIINGFADILKRGYKTKLDASGQEILDAIISHTRLMNQLIDDLLNFSKLGNREVKKKTADMDDMVKVVVRELKLANVDFIGSIQLNPLKPSLCDPQLTRQVWVNLISNAMKYSHKKENPHIEIGCEGHNGHVVYHVKDNGAGFDMQNADRLFKVFKRLHKQSDFEGTGIGLALVQKIITKHGGKIWAEAKLNMGASFYFTLPQPEHSN